MPMCFWSMHPWCRNAMSMRSRARRGAKNISVKLGAEKMRNSGMICISLPLIAGIAGRAAGTSAALT